MVINYLKYFTWLNESDILELETTAKQRPEQREAQRILARKITAMVHGETALTNAEKASRVLFGGEIEGLGAAEVQDIFQDVPSGEVATLLGRR